MSPSPHPVRPMQVADVARVAPMLARAFYDDPLQTWALPDDATRLDVLTRLFALQIEHGSLPLGNSWCEESAHAAATWAPPGRWQPDDAAKQAMSAMPAIVGDAIARLAIAFRMMSGAHPVEPLHWYLQGVGVDPEHQGTGLASAVLAPVLARCDREHAPAYLESTKARNVAIYEHLGWEVTGELTLPDDGPTIWTMWRDPR